MKYVNVLQVPLEKDLSGFVVMLKYHYRIPHRVVEEQGQQVLWVPEEYAQYMDSLYNVWLDDGSPILEIPQPESKGRLFLKVLRHMPVTVSVLLISLLVGLFTSLGSNYELLSYLSFTDFKIEGDFAYFSYLTHTLEQGQWWRLITPIFVHFGLLHLAMNSLWLWELGRRIEWQQGRLFIAWFILLSGVVSNAAEYWFSGPTLFGGLSGVLYALLGYCWIYRYFKPDAFSDLPKGVIVMLLAWLVLCLTGIVTWLGFGNIANAAHVGGLIVGCLIGALSGWKASKQVSK